jgi:ubiquinone biosynthesis protein
LEQFEIVKPYLRLNVAKKFSPIKMGEKVVNSIVEITDYMEDFPSDMKNAIRKINSGKVKVDLTHKGIDPMVHTLQRIAKQVVSAFIAMALIIGSSLLIINDVKPLWRNMSAFGLFGVLIAGIIMFGLLMNFKKGDYDN